MNRKTTILLMPLILAMTVDAASATTATQAWVKNSVGNPLMSNQVTLRDMLTAKDESGEWVKTFDTTAQAAIPAINELKAALDAKADAADVDLTELNSAIEALETGKASAEDLQTLQNTVDALGDTYATDAELTAQIEAVQALIPSLTDYVLKSELAAVATTGSYADLKDKPTIPSIDGLATSQDLTDLQTALEAEIAKKQAAGDYAALADMTAAKAAIEELKTGKADASTVATLQESISKLGDTYATDAELSAAIAAIDLTPFAKVADVESALALKENAANKVATATAEQIDAMSSEDKATQYPSISVAQTIANAAVTKVNEVAGDLSTLQTQVNTNTADIAEIKDAGYQTSTDVQGAITAATADLATKAEVNTALGDVYTKTEVDTAIGAIKEYDDTALAARVSTNETNIATNTSDIATNADAIAALQDAGFVAGAKTAGSYLVNFDASGKVSYASVEIVDDKGNPIDLTTGAIN
ncbi:MAG: hypothetical protein IJD69_02855 [Alphaproteobacteria bacterium]|nr:hypothetical protein [Alphaproteobacteria bacterium]